MERELVVDLVPIRKEEEQDHPVPSEWRPKLRDIVMALSDGNFRLLGLANVDPLDEATATGISNNIKDYGATLIRLPDRTWETSVCQWQLGYWEILVDLFTAEEGLSDLVLHVKVFEDGDGFAFKVHFVYVP